MRIIVTQLVEQLTQGIDRIVTVSAAANFGHRTVSMRLPPKARNGKSIGLLTVSVMYTTEVNQSIEIVKIMISGLQSDMIVKKESPSTSQTIARTSTLNVIGREPMMFTGLKRTSDITSIHTATRLIRFLRVVDLGRTGKKFGLRRAVCGAVTALLQAGCAASTAAIPTTTDWMSSMQRMLTREAELPTRESKSKATVPTAPVAL